MVPLLRIENIENIQIHQRLNNEIKDIYPVQEKAHVVFSHVDKCYAEDDLFCTPCLSF